MRINVQLEASEKIECSLMQDCFTHTGWMARDQRRRSRNALNVAVPQYDILVLPLYWFMISARA